MNKKKPIFAESWASGIRTLYSLGFSVYPNAYKAFYERWNYDIHIVIGVVRDRTKYTYEVKFDIDIGSKRNMKFFTTTYTTNIQTIFNEFTNKIGLPEICLQPFQKYPQIKGGE